MIYNIKKYHILFTVTSHNLTNGKKVFRPLVATTIINNPLQKTSGMLHSNLQVSYQSFCTHLQTEQFKAVKSSVKWQMQKV